VDDLSSVLHEVLKQIATQIVEKAKKGKKLTVREYLFLYLYLLSEDYKDKERRIKRGDAPAGGRKTGAP
jgi:uncharacterized coiled-coil DUF342 family protein